MILSPKRRLLGFLRLAGWPWLAALSLLELFLLVEPTAVALVTGELVGRLAQGAARQAASGVLPILAVLGALLVTGNVLRSMSQPLAMRVGRWIDAAVREELTSRVLALPALDRVEDAAVQSSSPARTAR